jgi:ornithine decarboxylase
VKVIAKKRGVNGVGWRYVIDESLYGHFSCIPFDHQIPAWFRVPSDSNKDIKRNKSEAILFGRTCDSLDVIAKGVMENLEVGDWLYFPLMGAYTSATASEFNGFPKPHIEKDEANLLPDALTTWASVNKFHLENPLTYSNALPPIV